MREAVQQTLPGRAEAPARAAAPVGRVEDQAERAVLHDLSGFRILAPGGSPRPPPELPGGGAPPPPEVRGLLGPRFGMDLGTVRFHRDAAAARAARGLRAQAFTLGEHVFFGDGAYQPQRAAGRRRIAHELAHVAQFRQGAPPTVRRDPTGNDSLFAPEWAAFPIFEEINGNDDRVIRSEGWGWEGEHVELLQRILIDLGYTLPSFGVDGQYGDETAAAVRDFQYDSGLAPHEIDGQLGHRTLRLLDQRISTRAYRDTRRRPSLGSGDILRFEVPVTTLDISSADYLKHVLVFSLEITLEQARVLVEEQDFHFIRRNEAGEWERAPDLVPTQAHLDAGYHVFVVRRETYEQVRGDLHRPDPTTGPDARERVTAALLDLHGTERLYELNRLIGDKATEIRGLRSRSVSNWGYHGSAESDIDEAEAELAALVAERDALLLSRGLTPEAFDQASETFKREFAAFAGVVALEMLEENAVQARIEHSRYENLDSVRELQRAIAELRPLWVEADRLWWQGISVMVAGDASLIHDEGDLYEWEQEHDGGASQYAYERGGGDPVMDAVEADLRSARRFRLQERHPSNTYFQRTFDQERAAVEAHAERAARFPILAYPGLELRQNSASYVGMDPEAFGSVLQAAIGDEDTGVLGSIELTRARLRSRPQDVWALPPVVARARNELGVVEGSIQEALIQEAQEEYEDARFWRDLGLAALGIGLGLAALASGPVGWAALAGGIVVGGIDAYIQYREISFRRDATDTALDPERALNDVAPGWFWFAVSLVSLGLDVVAVAKLLRTARLAPRAFRSGSEMVETVVESIGEQRRLLGGELASAVGEDAARIERELAQLDVVEEVVESPAFLAKADLLARVSGGDVQVLERLATALDQPRVLEALTEVEGLLTPARFTELLTHLGGPGHPWVSQLPDVVDIARRGGLADESADLLQEALTNPHVQRVMIDHADEPATIVEAWRAWRAAVTRPRNPTVLPFYRYLGHGLHFQTAPGRVRQLLVRLFGTGFHGLSNAAKNRQILRTTEGPLMTALRDGAGIPADVRRALDELLDEDLIGAATELAPARQRIVARVNEVIADNVDNQRDYQRMIDLLTQPGSRGALGEAFAEAQDLIPGLASARKVSVEVGASGLEEFEGTTRVIIDRFIDSGDVVAEIKVGSSFDPEQLRRYRQLYDMQDDLQDLLVEAGIESGQIERIVYQVLPGPSNAARVVDPAVQARRIWQAMVELGMESYAEVRYLARDSTRWLLAGEVPTQLP